jgi:hypothetical protein
MKKTIWLSMVISVVLGCVAQTVNISWDLRPATYAEFGYSPEIPIRIGYSKDLQKNINYCKLYIAGLRDTDMQPFQIVERSSINDPVYPPKYKGFLGLHKRDELPYGGILDLYVLVSDGSHDTLRLYFDIYHKDTLFVPRGLNFVPHAQKSISE